MGQSLLHHRHKYSEMINGHKTEAGHSAMRPRSYQQKDTDFTTELWQLSYKAVLEKTRAICVPSSSLRSTLPVWWLHFIEGMMHFLFAPKPPVFMIKLQYVYQTFAAMECPLTVVPSARPFCAVRDQRAIHKGRATRARPPPPPPPPQPAAAGPLGTIARVLHLVRDVHCGRGTQEGP